MLAHRAPRAAAKDTPPALIICDAMAPRVAGFTVGWTQVFGSSLIAGLTVHLTPAVSLKYTFRCLADTVEYPGQPPKDGIENGLALHVRF